MKKNCCAPIGKHQKILLKVLNCLWNKYIEGNINNTKTYLASPSEENYDNMVSELESYGNILNNSDTIKILNELIPDGGFLTYINIAAIYANGDIAYLYSAKGPVEQNLGTTKTIQVLNTDECIDRSYQIKPSLSTKPEFDNVWITEAILTERAGCAGVSNTGFISISIEADIAVFPFNPCFDKSCISKSKCSDKCDKSKKSKKSCTN